MFGRSISLLVSLFLVLLCLTPHVLADPEEQFQDLVRDVPEEVLHAALHDYGGPKFQHVKLAKRQRANTTTSNPPTTSGPAPTSLTSEGRTSTSGTPTTTAAPSGSSGVSSARRLTTSTSTTTRTTTGPNGLETFTDVSTVVVTPTEEPVPSETPTESSTTTPGLSGGGLRVSAANGATVAVVAALGFFML